VGVTSNIYPVREQRGGERASPLIPALCISDRLYEGGFISDKQQPTPSLGEICKQPATLPTKRWIFLIVGGASIPQIQKTLSVIENSDSDVSGVFTYCWYDTQRITFTIVTDLY
jgi:hypothetical protein